MADEEIVVTAPRVGGGSGGFFHRWRNFDTTPWNAISVPVLPLLDEALANIGLPQMTPEQAAQIETYAEEINRRQEEGEPMEQIVEEIIVRAEDLSGTIVGSPGDLSTELGLLGGLVGPPGAGLLGRWIGGQIPWGMEFEGSVGDDSQGAIEEELTEDFTVNINDPEDMSGFSSPYEWPAGSEFHSFNDLLMNIPALADFIAGGGAGTPYDFEVPNSGAQFGVGTPYVDIPVVDPTNGVDPRDFSTFFVDPAENGYFLTPEGRDFILNNTVGDPIANPYLRLGLGGSLTMGGSIGSGEDQTEALQKIPGIDPYYDDFRRYHT